MTDVHETNIVVVAILHRDGKVFIAKRATTKKTFPDRFELIGGHVDPGEQPEEALHRELMEEVQIQVVIDRPIFAFTYESEDMMKIEICYLCTLAPDSGEPVLDPNDHSTSLWIGEDQIDLFEKDDEETEALRRAFKYLKGL